MGNGHNPVPQEFFEVRFSPLGSLEGAPTVYAPTRKRPLWPALLLFLLTVLSTLAVGAEFAASYATNRQPFSGPQNPWQMMSIPFAHPRLLVLGIPFSFTLLAILLAHELGHYFACKIYGIDVSYPYFIPAPTLIGTFGAFIRIRSPITTRRALFDIGLAGPVAGFIVALPAVIYGMAAAKVVPHVDANATILFGNPPLMRIFLALFHPHVNPNWILLSPAGRAAWVGVFATALNLLPAWQLDGGHIVYTLAERKHRIISFGVAIALIALGWQSAVWWMWGGLLLILTLRFRHPPPLDRWQPLDRSRRVWALIALLIFLLCFTPWAVTGN